MKILGTPTEVTFLKGMWYKAHHEKCDLEYVWGPLPSRFLKVGKSFDNPTIFYRIPYEAAAERFLHDQGAGMKNFLQVPILRAFVAKWNKGKAKPLEDWQTQADGGLWSFALDEEQAESMMEARYGISREECAAMEAMISTAKPFTFLVHPGFMRLGLVDYALGKYL
jgi:hypothetical protein